MLTAAIVLVLKVYGPMYPPYTSAYDICLEVNKVKVTNETDEQILAMEACEYVVDPYLETDLNYVNEVKNGE